MLKSPVPDRMLVPLRSSRKAGRPGEFSSSAWCRVLVCEVRCTYRVVTLNCTPRTGLVEFPACDEIIPARIDTASNCVAIQALALRDVCLAPSRHRLKRQYSATMKAMLAAAAVPMMKIAAGDWSLKV